MIAPARQPVLTPPGPLKDRYDAVIIGAGGHGLAAAYHLAKDHGITDVAVLDRGLIGRGNTGRNTAIVRANYLTSEGVRFYGRSVELWQGLSEDLGLNLFYSARGHLTLAHTDAAVRVGKWRAEVNRHEGVESRFIGPSEVKELCPMIDLDCGGYLPILGALYHPPGAIAAHDAVAWGYARAAQRLGVAVHQRTAVTDILVERGRVIGVTTPAGTIKTDRVLCAVAGHTPKLTQMVGLTTPITVHPLQACVSEPLQPWLDAIVVSASLHCYVSQDARGDLVLGASLDPYELHSQRSTLDFLEGLCGHLLDLFPFLGQVKINRQWAGMADMTPDFSPIMGVTPVEGFFLDSGWGTWGFKATPVCGETMAATVARGVNHELIEPFAIDRFERMLLVGEKGAASVGH
ncbi:MAG: FAD-dependent oxidoreductase [Planctomycetota bacterium]